MLFVKVADVTASGPLAPEDGIIELLFTPSFEPGRGVILWIFGIKTFGALGRGRYQAFSVDSGNARSLLWGIVFSSGTVEVGLTGSLVDYQAYHLLIESGSLKFYKTVGSLLLLEIDLTHLSPQINSFREMLKLLG